MSFVIPPYSRYSRSGVSILELLVAFSLLSVVMVGGFTIFSTLKRDYLREAGFASGLSEQAGQLEALFVDFYDNDTFTAVATPAFPPDNPQTSENESAFTLTPIWGNNNHISTTGEYGCEITNVDITAASALIPNRCINALATSRTNFIATMETLDMPVLFPFWSSEPCLVDNWTDTASGVSITVENADCLRIPAWVGETAPGNRPLVLPEFVASPINATPRLTTAFFDQFGTPKKSTTMLFASRPLWREEDAIRYRVTSNNSDDNMRRRWIFPNNFRIENLLEPLVRQTNQQHGLIIETPYDLTRMNNPITRESLRPNLVYTNLSETLLRQYFGRMEMLHRRQNTAIWRIRITSGDIQWVRELMFEYDPTP